MLGGYYLYMPVRKSEYEKLKANLVLRLRSSLLSGKIYTSQNFNILQGALKINLILGNRGRNAGYPTPPAQIPACGSPALGSCLR